MARLGYTHKDSTDMAVMSCVAKYLGSTTHGQALDANSKERIDLESAAWF